MSVEMANKFIDKVKADPEMQNSLKDLVMGLFDGKGDPIEEIVAFAKGKGFDFIKDELKQALGGTDIAALLGGGGLGNLLGEGGAAGLMEKLGGLLGGAPDKQ